MNDLVFACSWDADRSKSWSGTHFALFNALGEHYNVIDFDMNLFHSPRLQILNKVLKYKLKVNTSGHFDSLLRKKYPHMPVFQFGDCPVAESNISYPYIDMAWKEVRDLYYNNNSVFRFSNYAGFKEAEIERKYEKQSGFFKKANCKAIFCMGKWMAKDLSSEHDNVFHAGGYKY